MTQEVKNYDPADFAINFAVIICDRDFVSFKANPAKDRVAEQVSTDGVVTYIQSKNNVWYAELVLKGT